MKLSEIIDQEQKPDPAVEAKKRQLKTLGMQLEASAKQLANFKKSNKENPALEKRVEDLKERIRKIKETIVDELELPKNE